MIKIPSVLLIIFSILNGSVVFWEPEIPVPGGNISIYYNTDEGALPINTSPVYVHLGYNGWLDVDDYEMTSIELEENGNWRVFNYSIPENASTIDFVFTDLNGNWDNNGGYGIDWHISLDYYWTPYNPGPNDVVTIILENIEMNGQIGWTIDDGNGHALPHIDYWPEGSVVEDGLLLSPLQFENNSLSIELGPFNKGVQIPEAIKFKILWEDGTWDSGSNGQIMLYDIYFNYNSTGQYEEIVFNSPVEDAEVVGPVNISCEGIASNVEFWIGGEMIGTDELSPFEVTWYPNPNNFGYQTIAARIQHNDGFISYSFLDFFLLFTVQNEAVPFGTDDGVTVSGNNIKIALYAPNKNFISIKGSWNTEFPNGEIMKLSGDTLWWYEAELENGEYTYQFNVDGEKLIADPWSKNVQWENSGGSESADFQEALTKFKIGEDSYNWTDQSFNIPQIKDVIIYEMHLGDFKGDEQSTGTYQDLIEKIENGYFLDLGINTIELMPVNEFEGGWSWGYNPTFYMAPESSYGSPEDLKDLINIAHEHDLSIIMDVVFNHLWGSSPLFQLYQPNGNYNYEDHDYNNCPYFHNQESDWGYKLQHWHSINGREYRAWKYVRDALIHWVDEYHFDGFRFDVTWGIGWGGDSNGASFYANKLRAVNPNLILIAEEDNATQVNDSEFNACWDFSFHHGVFEGIMGYNSNMDYLGNLLNPYNQGYSNLNGPVTYTSSHDEPRIIYEAENYLGLSTDESYELSKLGISLLMTSPGTPMIYHGQEFGQNSPRETNPQPLQWGNLSNPNGFELYNHYKNLIHLRKNNRVFSEGDYTIIQSHNNNSTIAFKRQFENEIAVIMLNFSDYEQTVNIDVENNLTWFEYIAQDSIIVDGFFNESLNPKSAKIFTNNPIELMGIEEIPINFNFIENYPNPFNGFTNIEIHLNKPNYVRIDIVDILGKKINNIHKGDLITGNSTFIWNGENIYNQDLSSGIYFINAQIGDDIISKKIMYLK